MRFQITSLLLFAGLGSLAAAAQTGVPAPPPGYQIAAGDVLTVNVVDFPTDSVPQTVVAPDGTVSLPLVGEVSVAGRSVGQTTALLTTKYKRYIVNPSVTVSLFQKHPETIVFSGSVMRPGVLDYRPGLHLLEALAESGGVVTPANVASAGGAAAPLADPTHVVVTHEDGTKQTLDLSDPQTEAGTVTDITLTPGDVVYVPQQTGKVSVVGEVKEPLVLPYRPNLTILEAISDCGSFNPDTADLVNAHLTHDGKDMPINLDPLLRHGDTANNITLSPGDQVVIPELKNRTFVFGDVTHPSFYLYKPGDRILDALSGAGGPLPQADLGKINIIHTDKVHQTSQMVRVNLNEFLLKGNISGNPFIQPGDSLYIPDKKHPFSMDQVLGALSGFSSAAYGINVLK